MVVRYVVDLLSLALNVYMWIIIARAVLSWVNPDPFNPIVRFLHRVTEPVLRPVRGWLPTYQIGLDLSPMIVLLGIIIVQHYVLPVLYQIASDIG